MRRDTATRRRPGRPTALTPERAQRIITTLRAGNHINTACYAAGVNTATFYRWMQRAERADHALDTGQPWDPAEQMFREFRDDVLRARAEVAERMVEVVQTAAVGGQLIMEEPALDGAGNPIRDEDGRVIMKRQWTQPDGRLALSYLKVAQPVEWAGGPSRMELSGPGGEPLVGDSGEADGDAVSRLASRVAGALAARQAEAMEAAEDAAEVHEGELVEDDEGGR